MRRFLDRRLVLFALGAAAGVVAALVLSGLLDDDKDGRPSVVRLGTAIPAAEQEALARRFRPVLHFDSAEPWRPLSIERFLGEGGQAADRGHRLCLRTPGPQDCQPFANLAGFLEGVRASPGALGQDLALDIAGERANGAEHRGPALGRCVARAENDCDAGDSTAIYYNVTPANGRFYVDYWWFFRYNDFPRGGAATACGSIRVTCSDHEGDWEGVTVVTGPRPPYKLEYVAFAAHEAVFRYADDEVTLDGERPAVYVARGSHASYPIPCATNTCTQTLRRVGPFRLPEGRSDGKAPWGRNDEDACNAGQACLLPFPLAGHNPADSWNAFAGRWGQHCAQISSVCPVADGPRSPGLQDRFSSPWCWRARERVTCDAATPGEAPQGTPGLATEADCRAWLGDLVAVLACDKRTVAAGLRPSRAGPGGSFTIKVSGEETSDAKTPGVAQVAREPLKPGERIVVTGVAPTSTELFVRAIGPKAVVEARFDRLGLEDGGRTVVRIRARDGVPRLTLRSPRGRIKPAELSVRRLPPEA